jgi:nucleoside-diphosphate-sugar epimerase
MQQYAIGNNNANGEVFNVGSGVSTSVENVLLLLMEKCKRKYLIQFLAIIDLEILDIVL